MDILKQFSKLELFTELFSLAVSCDERIVEWDKAKTKEECEKAEEKYYLAQEQWCIVMNEVKRRNIEAEYQDFCKLVVQKGWI